LISFGINKVLSYLTYANKLYVISYKYPNMPSPLTSKDTEFREGLGAIGGSGLGVIGVGGLQVEVRGHRRVGVRGHRCRRPTGRG